MVKPLTFLIIVQLILNYSYGVFVWGCITQTIFNIIIINILEKKLMALLKYFKFYV